MRPFPGCTRYPTVRSFILTARRTKVRRWRPCGLGAQDYLFKAWSDLKMLGRILQYAIERKRSERRCATRGVLPTDYGERDRSGRRGWTTMEAAV